MSNFKISVIIPFYNVERYISACLHSVCGQTLRELEIICIDDASPDGSREIVLDYMERDQRIQLITNEVNMGVSVARNRGIETARGEYIYIMDSDDFLCPEAMGKMYEEAQLNDADLVFADAYNFYEDGQCEYYFSPYKWRPLKTWMGHAAWWFIFKRSLVEEHRDIRFPADAHPGEDTVFSFMLFSFVERYSYLEMPIVYYRQHSGMCSKQLSGEKKDQYFRSLSICFVYLDSFMKNHPDIRRRRSDAYMELLKVLANETCDATRRRKDLPKKLRVKLIFYSIRRFVFRWKITKSGYILVKLLKVPIMRLKVDRFRRIVKSLTRA